jgi:ubiquinol-cytochrome c reductase cytochrome b subunit
MTVLVAMPLIARFRAGHRFNLAFLWAVMIAAAALTGMAVYEDRYAPQGVEFRFAEQQALIDGERAVELASEFGIPADGAGALIADDPFVQGPKLFKTYCADCHQPASLAKMFQNPPQAPELADVADRSRVRVTQRDWIRSILTDFTGHMASLKNITAGENAPASVKERAAAAATILDTSDGMASWSTDNREMLLAPENKEDLEALIEFLYAQAGHDDAIAIDSPQYARGRSTFESGTFGEEGLSQGCADCHKLHVRGEEEMAFDYGDGPDLTGYMGTEWLRKFIATPGDYYRSDYYGGEFPANAMPAFGEQLSPHDIDMVARWLNGEYHHAETAHVQEIGAAEKLRASDDAADK